MKSVVKILLPVCMFSSVSNAEQAPGFFVGLDVAKSIVAAQEQELVASNGQTISDEISYDALTTAISLGYRFDTNNRFLVSSTKIDSDAGSLGNEEFTGLDLDWHFVYGEERVLPYWGIGFGFYTYEDTAAITQDNEDISGVAVNLMGGIKYSVIPQAEFDLSYRIKSIAWQDLEFTNGMTLSLNESISSINIGAAYLF